jgi:hypothetical protein
MNIQYKDFIGTYTNVYPEGFCEHLIDQFNVLQNSGAGYNRQESENASKLAKDDWTIFINLTVSNVDNFNGMYCKDVFFNGLQQCFDMYTNEYPALKNVNIRASHLKMQKIKPGGGYHTWHFEQGNGEQANRCMVYMVYLNTLESEDAGETEFLYQQTRLQPVSNTVVLWPAGYTHVHRGNVVFGENPKYIATGWFNIVD